MKKSVLIPLILGMIMILPTICFSQEPMPTDFSAGYGFCHGGIGVKMTGNNVLIAGLGLFDDVFGWQIGLQYPIMILFMDERPGDFINSLYFSGTYGVIGSDKSNSIFVEDDTKAVLGWNLMMGYLIGFGSEKKMFLDIAGGYYFGKITYGKDEDWEFEEKFSGFSFDVGIGYRFIMQ